MQTCFVLSIDVEQRESLCDYLPLDETQQFRVSHLSLGEFLALVRRHYLRLLALS